ncbi:MAG: helix-turn-helix transcriptional regulator [Dehalococcoidia bacterium]
MDVSEEYVTAEEAIGRLGIGRATFYNYARSLDRFRRVGDRRVLYRASDIEALAAPQPIRSDEGEKPPVIYQTKRRRRAARRSKGPD